ncbi:MAG: hypothetical protein LAP87_08185 [Acidobacteriia bacterium]|nr:hypothetical protein [Terriglobia bacterium]
MKEPNVKSHPLPQQVCVRLANVWNEASPGRGLKHSQTASDRQARRSRDATRLSFIQKDQVGWETLGQKDGAALARAKAPACLLQQRIRVRPLRCNLDPDGVPHFLGAGEATPLHGHFLVDFGGEQNAPVE